MCKLKASTCRLDFSYSSRLLLFLPRFLLLVEPTISEVMFTNAVAPSTKFSSGRGKGNSAARSGKNKSRKVRGAILSEGGSVDRSGNVRILPSPGGVTLDP